MAVIGASSDPTKIGGRPIHHLRDAGFTGAIYPITPHRDESRQLYTTSRELFSASKGKAVPLKTLAEASGLGLKRTQVLVAWLASAGILERGSRGLKHLRDFDNLEELDTFLSAYEQRHRTDRERLQRMMRYGQTPLCRVQYFREYFGETTGEACEACD